MKTLKQWIENSERLCQRLCSSKSGTCTRAYRRAYARLRSQQRRLVSQAAQRANQAARPKIGTFYQVAVPFGSPSGAVESVLAELFGDK